MSFNIEQINTFVSKELTIFFSVLCVITNQIVTGEDVICRQESFLWGPENIPIIWKETIATTPTTMILSECLLDDKQLSPRYCDSRDGEWKPELEVMKSELCRNYQPSHDGDVSCPPNYIESKTNGVCYLEITSVADEAWNNYCLFTGGSSLSFLDLSSTEQYSILQQLLTSNPHESNIGLPATNMEPSKKISSHIDYSKEDLELQWMLPGRYGTVIKFNENSASIVHSFQNIFSMCLSINTANSTKSKPFKPTVEACADVRSVLCVSKTKSVMHGNGCSTNGYFRVGYATDSSLCYSIKMFSEPLDVTSNTEAFIEVSCEGNKIFQMETLESNTIFRQLAFATKLKRHDRCLFGVLSLNEIIKITSWESLDHNEITFTNWDKTVNVNDYMNRGDGSFLTLNSDGKWSWEEKATCIVCVMEDPPSAAQLLLSFNNSDFLLTLTVIGQKHLWKDDRSQMGFLCFALTENNYTSVSVNPMKANESYLVTNVGPGLYWCSGHIYQTLELVESNQVYAFGMIFAVYVEYHCEEECGDPGEHAVTFKDLLNTLIVENLMQVKNFEHVYSDTDETESKLKMMFHLTVSFNETFLAGHQQSSYNALKRLQHLQIDDAQFNILSIKSREFCFPDSIASSVWAPAKVGDSIELTVNCFNFIRTCSRIGSDGAEWESIVIFTCNNESETTRNLINLHLNFRFSNQIPEVILNLTTTLQNNTTLIGGDVFIVSQIFETISHFLLSDQILLTQTEFESIFEIINSIMSISEYVAKESSKLNSTNSILASFEEIIIQQTQLLVIQNETFLDVVSITSPLVANFILDPLVSGFSGIVFLRNETLQNEDFLNYSTRYLQANQSIDSLLKEENLVVASFVPQKLIENVKNPKIIFTLFFNDVLFQASKNYKCSDGIVISLTILNSDSKLSSSVPFYFKPNVSLSKHHNYRSAQFCGYWSFTSIDGWESTGCLLNELSFKNSNIILCECLHLTHFGNLINTEIMLTDFNERILNLITLAGCTLSLIGIIGIFITAWVFHSWRSKSSSKFLLQLSAAIALQMILLIFINSDDDILATIANNLYGCIATGALIHYSILVMFFWMLIVAYLQFIRYVIVFNQIATANFLLKSSIFGWGIPLLPVFIVIAVNPASYIPASNVKFCYPSGYGLMFGLLIPIALIVITNIFVFIAVIISLIKGSSKSSACKVNSDKNEAMWSQLRLSVFLFFVLGMTWIFGFLSILSESILFSYLFCLTATTQGFVLFFYFVILDPVARNLWKQLLGKIFGYKKC